MLPWLLTGFLATIGTNLAATTLALNTGRAYETDPIFLGTKNPVVIDSVQASIATSGAWGITYLWKHNRKKTAITLAIVSIAAHGAETAWDLHEYERAKR